MPKLFPNARRKVEWSKEHINKLNAIFRDFSEGTTHEVFIEHDPHGGEDRVKVKATKLLPVQFALTLGDAVHNLWTALDYVINDIELLRTGVRSKHTKFPIYPSRQALESAMKRGFEEKTSKQIVECILDSIQPYPRGNGEAIACLHNLDVMDKHQLVIAKTEFKDVTGIRIKDDSGKEFLLDNWRVKDHLVVGYKIRESRNAKVTDQGKATYRVEFGEGLPFAGEMIIPVLVGLTNKVGLTINELEQVFRLSHI